MMLGGITCLTYLQYALWAELMLRLSGSAETLDLDYINQQLPYFYLLTFCSLLLSTVPYVLDRLYGDSPWYEYGAVSYYGLSLCYFSFHIGTLSLPVGAVLVGAPVVGFIFFNRRAVALTLVICLLVQVVLSFGSSLQWWGYAPVFKGVTEWSQTPTPFSVFQMYFYTMPHMVLLIAIAYLVLRRWRDREERVRYLSITDPLTGLFNRRSILYHLEQEYSRSRNKGPVLSLLMVDLDHFKSINDELGHEAGDYALIAAADALQQSLRQNDRVGRYGGEEFLIILPGTDLQGAKIIGERCRMLLEGTRVQLHNGGHVELTGSFGLVCNEGNVHLGVDEMLRLADQAMYQAKEKGRNQVVSIDLAAPLQDRHS